MTSGHFIRRFCLLAFAFAASSLALAQNTADTRGDSANTNPQVIMLTSMGDIIIELDAKAAPQTVDNFLAYVDSKYYENTVFHRVIEGFMIQGGGFTTALKKKDTRPPISNEAYNGLKNRKYSIAMARTSAPHSASSQFFINTNNNSNLDHTATTARGWGYAVFGRVIEGQQVVDAISQVKTGSGGQFSQDVPAETIVIKGIERLSPVPVPAND